MLHTLVKAKQSFVCISLVLLGAKAKFLRKKPSVLVALEEISEMCIFSTGHFAMFGCEVNNKKIFVCDADAESLS